MSRELENSGSVKDFEHSAQVPQNVRSCNMSKLNTLVTCACEANIGLAGSVASQILSVWRAETKSNLLVVFIVQQNEFTEQPNKAPKIQPPCDRGRMCDQAFWENC